MTRQNPTRPAHASHHGRERKFPPDPSLLLATSVPQGARQNYARVLDQHEDFLTSLGPVEGPALVPRGEGQTFLRLLEELARGHSAHVDSLSREYHASLLASYDLLNNRDNEWKVRDLRARLETNLIHYSKLLLDLKIDSERVLRIHSFFLLRLQELDNLYTLIAYQERILGVYLQCVSRHREGEFSDAVRQAIALIRRHPDKRLSLSEIAKHIGLHPNYLSRKFPHEVGMTLTEYMDQERLQYIQKQLKETDLPLETIARELGFSNASYFSTYFKKLTGMSPSEYRKRHRLRER